VNPWPFIAGAYGLTILGTIALLWSSYAAMRRAEAEAGSRKEER